MNTFFDIFKPKSFVVLKEGYKRSYFMPDLLAGLTVGVVALPLAMAFAIASGLGPEKGLYTAIVAGFIISFLGGSRFQIGGPTGAFVVIVFDIVLRHGYEGLAVATLMAGVFLIIMGLLRLGAIIKYIPYPVITGFTSGIALIIFTTQINDFLGLSLTDIPADFIGKWSLYFSHLSDTDWYNFLIALAAVIIILLCKRFIPKIPGPIIAIIFLTLIVSFFNLPVDTIESHFGELPRTLPLPSLPSFDFTLIKTLIPDALTIALLGAIESLLSAVVADGMTGKNHKSDTELMAQGSANIFSIVFGGIPATGAIARTATNIKSGAKTPLSGIIHAISLTVFMFLFAPYIIKVPMAVMAAILIVVAWNMSEAHHFRHILKGPKHDAMVLLTTFLLTVLVDLTIAVQVGVVMAALLFIKRIIEVTQIQESKLNLRVTDKEEEENDPDGVYQKKIPEGTEVYEIDGPFFFGVADSLKRVLETLGYTPKVFILRMRKVPVIDATGLHALEEFFLRCQKQNTRFILSGVNSNVEQILKDSGFYAQIGEENLFDHIDKALNSIK